MERALRRVESSITELDLEQIALEMAAPIEEDAQALAPRRTGRLAGEIASEVTSSDRQHAEVATGPSGRAWYGFFQEFGTRFHPAHPFLRPAFDGNRRRALRTARQRFWALLRRAARGA